MEAEKGVGALDAIGGNAPLAAGLAAVAPAPPPNGLGALAESGGKAALATGLATGAEEDAENGFLGGAALIGGNALLEAEGFAAVGTGAEGFEEAEKGVGALAARGGKLALDDDAVFSSFFSDLSDPK